LFFTFPVLLADGRVEFLAPLVPHRVALLYQTCLLHILQLPTVLLVAFFELLEIPFSGFIVLAFLLLVQSFLVELLNKHLLTHELSPHLHHHLIVSHLEVLVFSIADHIGRLLAPLVLV